ncbi:MAG: hypothetical protein IJT44_04700 [Clostridia bacterium]|nr:hypothetical protein [Clostridia bacterium]
MKKAYAQLDGAWEERGVIGTRIEIDGGRITVLWCNTPVLETVFKIQENGGELDLILKKNGLRYAGSAADYATVERIGYRDGALTLCEYFPITGESCTVLTKTENSRFGNYEIADGVLRELQGTWKTADGLYEIVVRRDELQWNGKKRKICVLRSKSPYEPQGRYLIADQDPAVCEWEGFSRFEYDGGRLTTRLFVCDAPGIDFVFEKAR